MMENENFGKFFIFPIRGTTTTHVFDTLNTYNQIAKLDVFGYDYIGYAQSEVNRQSIREELNYIIKDTKVKTLNFDGKRGIVTVSPYAVGRGKWEKADVEGRYNLSCMAESSEAEKAADIVWSVLKQEAKTTSQLLKNRDGPIYAAPFEIKFDGQTNRFEPVAKVAAAF
jgi:hypothetical protein